MASFQQFEGRLEINSIPVHAQWHVGPYRLFPEYEELLQVALSPEEWIRVRAVELNEEVVITGSDAIPLVVTYLTTMAERDHLLMLFAAPGSRPPKTDVERRSGRKP